MTGVKDVLRNIVTVVLLTIIPVVLIVRLWHVILTYWMLILSVFLIGTGMIFFYFYIKNYSLKILGTKIKEYFEKREIDEILWEGEVKKTAESGELQRSSGFWLTGVFLEFVGLYLLIRFFQYS